MKRALAVFMLGVCLLVLHGFTARTAAGKALKFYPVRGAASEAGLDVQYKPYPQHVLDDIASHLPPELLAIEDDYERAVALIQWVDDIGPTEKTGPSVWTLDPRRVYQNIDDGNRGICLDWSVLYTAVLQSTGARARELSLVSDAVEEPEFAHVITELWLESEQRWIVMDATCGGSWTQDGRALSAAEVHAGLGGDLAFECLRKECSDYPLASYNHVFYWERSSWIAGYFPLPDRLKRNDPPSKLVKQYFKPTLVRLGESAPSYSPRYRALVLFVFPLLEGLAGIGFLWMVWLWRRS